MAQSTVDLQKMRIAARELDNIYAGMMNQLKKLDENASGLQRIWKGDAAQSYQKTYLANTQNFLQLAESINSCSKTLTAIAASYNKADLAAADAIKAKMAKG